MDSISSLIKEEDDIFFKCGVESVKRKIVKNLLLANTFTISEITSFGDVTEEFVQKIKDQLQ